MSKSDINLLIGFSIFFGAMGSSGAFAGDAGCDVGKWPLSAIQTKFSANALPAVASQIGRADLLGGVSAGVGRAGSGQPFPSGRGGLPARAGAAWEGRSRLWRHRQGRLSARRDLSGLGLERDLGRPRREQRPRQARRL